MEEVENATVGFAHTTTIELLNHLYYSYVTITTTKMEDDSNTMVTHRWELLRNCRDLIGVMVVYLLCWRAKRIIVPAITDLGNLYTYTVILVINIGE